MQEITKVFKMKINNVLQINSSINNESGNSYILSKEFTTKLTSAQLKKGIKTNLVERDLVKDELPHLTQAEMAAWMTPETERTDEQSQLANISDTLVAELQNMDTLVIGMPMYNFGIPSTFKAWIDRVARAGITFKYTEQGPVGLLEGKKAIIVAARGGMYQGTPKDTQTHYLKDVMAFIGITDVQFIYAEGLAMSNKDENLVIAKQAMDIVLGSLI
jgi:FMN-dependent NADH-azoreductase